MCRYLAALGAAALLTACPPPEVPVPDCKRVAFELETERDAEGRTTLEIAKAEGRVVMERRSEYAAGALAVERTEYEGAHHQTRTWMHTDGRLEAITVEGKPRTGEASLSYADGRLVEVSGSGLLEMEVNAHLATLHPWLEALVLSFGGARCHRADDWRLTIDWAGGEPQRVTCWWSEREAPWFEAGLSPVDGAVRIERVRTNLEPTIEVVRIADGVVEAFTHDYGADGVDERGWTERSADRVVYARDQGADGTVDFEEITELEAGSPVRFQRLNRGHLSREIVWAYDADGLLQRETTDDDGDGDVDHERSWSRLPGGVVRISVRAFRASLFHALLDPPTYGPGCRAPAEPL